MYLKRGDEIVVIAGNDRGKRGKVLHVDSGAGRILVEGVNVRVKHLRKSTANPQGGRVEREMPIHVSNVLLWSSKAGKGVRARIVKEKGRKVRIGIPCGTKFD
ncbi:MAG: 50S ribosomal protein L24 [Planctomycetota bacterium]